jgi:hypothetical protein
MKKLLILLALFCFLSVGALAESVPQQQQQVPIGPGYWACYQVGTVPDLGNVFVVSDVYYSNGPQDKHVKLFGEIVKKFEPDFKPVFEPSCVLDDDPKKMKKKWIKKINQAIKRKFTIIQINLTAEE